MSLTCTKYQYSTKQSNSSFNIKRVALILSLVFIFHFSFFIFSFAQTTPTTTNTEQQIENVTAANDDNETEDDSYLQQLQSYIKNPLNLNTATEASLKELLVLTPLQITNLISYRNLLGNFTSIYEIQAIPGWDVETIQKIKPYITVEAEVNAINTVKSRLQNGDQSILIRATQVLEKSKGYKITNTTATNFYPGSQKKLLVRYRYNFKNLLQFGVLGEKDAGEQFFKGKQKQGFDFYSAHLFIRNVGNIKAIALGDFTVNLGQGLTQWQSLAFKKSSDVLNIKRQSAVLRPYNSAGEIFFHRGVGVTIQKNNWQATLFGSYRNIDANFVADTLPNQDDYISSLQTSGYHRTKSETDDKGVQRQIAFGGNLSYQKNNLHIGINGVQYQFKLALVKDNQPYNKYALSGSSFGNYSIDYSYTFKNLHFFGEAAITQKMDKAFVNGLLISVANNVDVSLLYRNIERSYQSLYTNAFTESTYPTNEKGLYVGASIKPSSAWRLDAYIDYYSFPWLKYRVDKPTNGSDYLVQLTYKPNKQFEVYGRFRTESKSININPNNDVFPTVTPNPKQSLRLHSVYKLSDKFMLRNRLETIWFDKRGSQKSLGYLTYVDVAYKPLLKPLSLSVRLQYFETNDYNSRIYAFENDVLYSYSIPVFYDKGFRYYINANYDISRKLSVWCKVSQYMYPNKSLIGSGLDEISGNHKTEVKLQAIYQF